MRRFGAPVSKFCAPPHARHASEINSSQCFIASTVRRIRHIIVKLKQTIAATLVPDGQRRCSTLAWRDAIVNMATEILTLVASHSQQALPSRLIWEAMSCIGLALTICSINSSGGVL
jgi:hypothetical protein